MFTAFGWVVFGMAVWGLCIMLHALQRRFAPEMEGGSMCMGAGPRTARRRRRHDGEKDREIAELKKRVETLEAIVTDRRFQWEQDFRQSR